MLCLLCYVMLCYVMLCHVMLCYVMLCYVMLCYVMLCYVMLCYVMLCYVMLCYVMLCYGLPRLTKDQRVWICLEHARFQNAAEIRRRWPGRWGNTPAPTIRTISATYTRSFCMKRHATTLWSPTS